MSRSASALCLHKPPPPRPTAVFFSSSSSSSYLPSRGFCDPEDRSLLATLHCTTRWERACNLFGAYTTGQFLMAFHLKTLLTLGFACAATLSFSSLSLSLILRPRGAIRGSHLALVLAASPCTWSAAGKISQASEHPSMRDTHTSLQSLSHLFYLLLHISSAGSPHRSFPLCCVSQVKIFYDLTPQSSPSVLRNTQSSWSTEDDQHNIIHLNWRFRPNH